MIAHFEGRGTLAEAIETIKIETRRFAKNQRTWMRRLRANPGGQWINAAEVPEALWARTVSDALRRQEEGRDAASTGIRSARPIPPPGGAHPRMRLRTRYTLALATGVLFGVGFLFVSSRLGPELAIVWCVAIGPVIVLQLIALRLRPGNAEGDRIARGMMCLDCRYPLVEKPDGTFLCPECGGSWTLDTTGEAPKLTFRGESNPATSRPSPPGGPNFTRVNEAAGPAGSWFSGWSADTQSVNDNDLKRSFRRQLEFVDVQRVQSEVASHRIQQLRRRFPAAA